MLLNATKCQVYSFFCFQAIKEKPTGGDKTTPSSHQYTHTQTHTHTHTHSHTHRLGLTEKQQKYQHYNPEKLINMNILQVKK